MFFDVVLDALIATSKGFFPCIGITKCSWSKRLDFTNVQTVLKQHTVCPADLGPVVLLPAWVPSILEGKLVDIQSPLFFFWNATSYLTQPRNARWETIWSSWWAISWEMFVRSVSSSAWVAVAAFLKSFNVWGVDHWIKHHNVNRYIMYTPLMGNSFR